MSEATHDDEPRLRILRALGSMPYGAAAHFRYPDEAPDHRRAGWEGIDLELTADNLERLRDVLVGVAARDQEREHELYRLRAWVTAVETLAAEAARLAAEPPAPPADSTADAHNALDLLVERGAVLT